MQRVKGIFSLIKDVEVMVIKGSSPSFFYITGLQGEYEGAVALAWRDGRVDVLLSQLEETPDSEISFHRIRDRKEMKEKLIRLTNKAKRIGFDGRYTSYADYKDIRRTLKEKRFYDVGKELLRARLIKDRYEIESIEKACKIVSRIATELPELLKDGITEREVANEIANRMRRYGARKEAFSAVVAFGKNSAIPHHLHGERKLKRGDIVLSDFGAVVNGYISDISRTFVYGRASKSQSRMYEVVLGAQRIGIESLKEGITFASLHRRVQRYIDKTEFKGRFLHSTGHSIGIEVHDGFEISAKCRERFSSGMAFTIEPGIYLPGIGGVRIEDDVVIEEGRIRVLTSAPKDFEV
jgi:Xaa-Pro dipeptidase